ncbi:MAG TPA: hypothetical protein VM120_03725 [Bryobacteraceae bacterium]|nr:hypothetical protein [Bryobacteraceae bacterium]
MNPLSHQGIPAAEIAQNRALLSARDAVHIAVRERHGVRSILRLDAAFDRWPGLQRIQRFRALLHLYPQSQ